MAGRAPLAWVLVVGLAACGESSTDRSEAGHSGEAGHAAVALLLDRVAQGEIESPVMEVSGNEPVEFELGEIEVLDEAGGILGLPLPVALLDDGRPEQFEIFDRQGTRLETGTEMRVIPAHRSVPFASLDVFAGFPRKRGSGGFVMVKLDRPGSVRIPLERFGGVVSVGLNWVLAPRDLELSELEPVPAMNLHLPDGSEESLPLTRTGLMDVAFGLRGAKGPQELLLEFSGLADGFRQPRVLLRTLTVIQKDGLDRLLLPADVMGRAQRVRYLPASPPAVRSMFRARAKRRPRQEVTYEGPILPGLTSVTSGAPQQFEILLDGESVARAEQPVRELLFDVTGYRRRKLTVRSTKPLRRQINLIQPQANFAYLHSRSSSFHRALPTVRGLESSARFHPLVRHVRLDDHTRRSLLLPPGSRVEIPITAEDGSTLELFSSVNALSGEWDAPRSTLECKISLRNDGQERELLRITGDDEEIWREREVQLPEFEGEAALVFEAYSKSAVKVAMQEFAFVLGEPRVVRKGPPSAPNLLVFLVDTLRADHLSSYGYHRRTTPRIDELAEDGVLFERAYAQGPWTRPSVASLVTGLLYSFHNAGKRSGLSPELTTLAERMRDAGYQTAAFMANAYVHGPSLNFEQGFESFVGVEDKTGSSRATAVNSLVLPWLDRNHDRPFFLYVHTIDPHAPYDPPEQTAGHFNQGYAGLLEPRMTHQRSLKQIPSFSAEDLQYLLDLYDEEIRFGDQEFGKLVDKLRELDLYDNTIVVVLSDHGEEFYEHQGFGHGSRLWEELIRVPLVVKWCGEDRPRGVRVEDPVSVIDLLPTLAGQLPISGRTTSFQGTDLQPWWQGPAPRLLPVISEEEPGLRCLILGKHKLIESALGPGEWRRSLFELSEDPGEQRDLAAASPDEAARFSARLEQVMQELFDRGFRKAETLGTHQLTEEERRALLELGYGD